MMKINIRINNKKIEVEEGITVHKAAEQAGIKIPVMCENDEVEHFSSCMVCLVKDVSTGKLFPSCSMLVQEGMDILADDDEVLEARKISLELLLSEHVGDCEAPCVISCPAHMDIPLMNRLLEEGKDAEAIKVIKKDIALPAVLGRICPAPCEAACRRKGIDGAVSICLLKRYAADRDLKGEAFNPDIASDTGKSIAIIGSGPAGLAAAYYLKIRGHMVKLFEREDRAGGELRTGELKRKLPVDVLDREIDEILKTGVEFLPGSNISKAEFEELLKKEDAVILASGKNPPDTDWGLEMGQKGIMADRNTYQTSNPKVFAIGNALRVSKLAVRSVGQGKEAAFAVDQLLSGENIIGEYRKFNSRFGKLTEKEQAEFLKEATKDKRIEPYKGMDNGFLEEEARTESARCMHCDCRKKDACLLRDLSDLYNASQRSFYADSRVETEKHIHHEYVIYEPAKCIKCGICVRLTRKYKEKYGLSFIGRGFDVRIGVPFNEELNAGLSKTAEIVVEACPTGALSKK